MRENAAIAQANQDLLRTIQSIVPGDLGIRIDNLYGRSAYPELYGEEKDLLPLLAVYGVSPDIAEHQRLAVIAIMAEYRAATRAYRLEYVEARRTIDSWFPDEEATPRDARQVYQANAKLNRIAAGWEDLNDSTVLELAGLLDESELAVVPALSLWMERLRE